MRSKILVTAIACAFVTTGWAASNETPKELVATYETLADAILALNHSEENIVRAILDTHRRAAAAAQKAGDHEGVAAEMALFANEGDNAVGGIRKRLLEGGHHHNAAGEAQGIFEPGFVIVTREVKKQVLEAAAAYQKSAADPDRAKAFEAFSKAADSLQKK